MDSIFDFPFDWPPVRPGLSDADDAARWAGSEEYFRDQVYTAMIQRLAAEEAQLPAPQDMGEDG